MVSSKIYDERDDINFEIVLFFHFLKEMFLAPLPMFFISQLNCFARECSYVDGFNSRNMFLTVKLLNQGYRCHKIRKAFSKIYHRHSDLIVKYNIGLKTLLQQGISEHIYIYIYIMVI